MRDRLLLALLRISNSESEDVLEGGSSASSSSEMGRGRWRLWERSLNRVCEGRRLGAERCCPSKRRSGFRARYMSYSSSGYSSMSASAPLLCLKLVVSMKRRPRLDARPRSRADLGEEYFLDGPRGSEAVRIVPKRGSSLLRAALERSRRSGREA